MLYDIQKLGFRVLDWIGTCGVLQPGTLCSAYFLSKDARKKSQRFMPMQSCNDIRNISTFAFSNILITKQSKQGAPKVVPLSS